MSPASERIKVLAQAPLVGTASFEMAVKSEKFLESDGGTYRPYDNQNSSSPLDDAKPFKELRAS